MKIKLLEEKDIANMQEILHDDDMIFNLDFLKNFLSCPNAYGFIASIENKIVGFAYAYSLLRPDGKTMFYLHSIGVLPAFQNLGVGTKMMDYIVNFAKENNFSEVFVITDKANNTACHVYEKTGFTNEIENEVVYVNELK